MVITCYTIYNNKNTYLILRRFIEKGEVIIDENYVEIADTIEEARAKIPPNLFCFPREQDDDIKIIESYI
jgi:hypothetical protein